jgi:hypothetical protein
MIRAVADDCFDRRAKEQLNALADKIDEDIKAGLIVMYQSKDNQDHKRDV